MALAIPHNGNAFMIDQSSPGGWFEEGLINMEKLREFFGGWVELVTFAQPLKIAGVEYAYLACNEEGKLMKLPLNMVATSMVTLMGALPIDDMIVGNAVLLERSEIN
jgi:hypothetical protein